MKLDDCRSQGRKSAGFNAAYDREIDFTPTAILEIGVQSGGSLYMWRERFPDAKVVGIDNDPNCGRPDGIPVVIDDGHNPETLRRVWDEFGPFDLVIDDGSHQVADQIRTFETVLPLMAHGGLYACEDTHTSYWREFARRDETTFVAYAKAAIDELHAYARNSPRHHLHPTFPVEPNARFSSMAVYPGIVFFRT